MNRGTESFCWHCVSWLGGPSCLSFRNKSKILIEMWEEDSTYNQSGGAPMQHDISMNAACRCEGIYELLDNDVMMKSKCQMHEEQYFPFMNYY